MTDGAFWELGNVADHDLQRDLLRLLAIGSRTEARIIAHLAAVEERQLHLEAGSSSLFDYCCTRLGLSESEAFHRITAARLGRQFPLIFSLLERRAIHLTGACLLRDYLTPKNHRELLEQASGRTKLQVQELLARRFPRPDVTSAIRKLPAPRAAVRTSAPSLELSLSSPVAAHHEGQTGEHAETGAYSANVSSDTSGELHARAHVSDSAHSAHPARRDVVEPLSAERYRIQLNASARLKEKLERARDLLSHANPSGDLAAVIERALDLLIERTQAERFGQTKRPRHREASNAQKNANTATIRFRVRGHIANSIKRQIAARDGLRCTFVGADGQRCTATRLVQIHHEHPWARGGNDSADNLRILCAAHNRWQAERDFGRALVQNRIRRRRASLVTASEDARQNVTLPGKGG